MAGPCQVLSRTDAATARTLVALAAGEARRVEAKYSRYRAGNIVDRINSADGAPIEVDAETADLIDFAAALHDLSDGLFDITSGVLRELWRFDGSDRVPDEAAVKRILVRVGWHRVTWQRPTLRLMPGMQIDFGGICKEYAVDRAAERISAVSDAACLINFGGDLAVTTATDGEPWRVGIERPDRPAGDPLRRIALRRGGLATSGDAHRFLVKNGIRYGHLLDPRTGWPVADAPRSVTVAADSCTQAGMLSSIAMLNGAAAEAFLERNADRHWCVR